MLSLSALSAVTTGTEYRTSAVKSNADVRSGTVRSRKNFIVLPWILDPILFLLTSYQREQEEDVDSACIGRWRCFLCRTRIYDDGCETTITW